MDGYDSSPGQHSFGLLEIAWKRKALIALGIVLGLLGGWLYYLQRTPLYESTAQIKVERTFAAGPVQGVESQMTLYEDYLATQMELLKSQRIVGKAVHEGKLNELPSFAGQTEAAATANIQHSLSVTRVVQPVTSTATNLLNLTVRGPNSSDCMTVLQQLILSYDGYLKADRDKSQKQSWRELDEMHQTLDKKMTEKTAELRRLQKLNKLVRTKDGSSLQLDILTNIQGRRANVAVQRAETKMRLEAIKAALAKGEDPTPYLDLTKDSSKFSTGAETVTLDDLLRPLFVKEKQLLEQFGPAYPEVRDIRAQIKATREVWEDRHPENSKRGPGAKEKAVTKETVDAFITSLTAQLAELELTEKALTEFGDAESKTARELAVSLEEEDALRKEIEDKRELARSYRKRMDEVNLIGDRGGIVSETTAEPAQGYQVEPKPMPIVLASLLGGLLLGVGMAWLAEVTDQSFRNPDDIRRRLKVQVLGHVPRIMPSEEEKQLAERGQLTIDPSVCAYYHPKSVDAEAFRGLRTTLFFKLEGEGHKIIQITSPNMGDGKTTLATNLAVSIAQSGKRILLVDADFRRPRLHKMFGLDSTTGLASVIAESAKLQDAIKSCSVPNLYMLPCGPRPSNPAELLTSKRFLDLLEALRGQFDVILIDTPPLLAVSDPSVVAPRVDGVILTIRVAKNGRPAAERAREILTNLGANVYGVVVNGIDSGSNQGYGASQYGYTYHYAYGYAYDSGDNNSYYHDDEGEEVAVGTNGSAATNGKHSRHRHRRRRSESRGLIGWLRSTLWR
jgi:capsular exopolysaccharide synthesis family protein